MRLLYNIGIFFYWFGIFLASFFNKKAKSWVEGRRNFFKRLESKILKDQSIIWVHCASLGEFEQGRPLIEKIKKEAPESKIILTFFSPSGYEIRKNYQLADYIFYLPLDTKTNAEKFLNIVKPKAVYFVKYEFWYHYLKQLNDRNIPTFLISAVFRKEQIFFRSYGSFFKKILHFFDHIFVQDEYSKTILLQNKVNKVSVAGDTRVDRVLEIQKNVQRYEKIETFKGTAQILIGGSTWSPDENILIEWIHQQNDFRWKLIIAPHDISEKRILQIEKKLDVNSVRFSKGNAMNLAAAKVLIIDNIGMLSSIYQYGKVAFIGGGFGSGIHNTLEPIGFGLPVFFGGKFKKFEEAKYLIKSGGGFSISSFLDFENKIKMLEDEFFYNNASTKAANYILLNKGATDVIFSKTKKYL